MVGYQSSTKDHLSLRMDSVMRSKLQTESIAENVTLSQIIINILQRYLDWDSLCSKSGSVPLHKKIIIELMERIDEKELSDIANKVALEEFKDVIIIFKNEFTLDSWLEVFDSWLKASGFTYKHEKMDYLHTIVMNHEMGHKFSLFQQSFLAAIFGMFSINPEFIITTDSILIKFSNQISKN